MSREFKGKNYEAVKHNCSEIENLEKEKESIIKEFNTLENQYSFPTHQVANIDKKIKQLKK